MRLAIFLATLVAMSASAVAGAIKITSPDHPQTYAYGATTWRQLYLEPSNGGLMARITFSNLPYAGDDNPRRDEPFDFQFPGVRFDRARSAFFASGRRGELIPVARFRGSRACGWIDLAEAGRPERGATDRSTVFAAPVRDRGSAHTQANGDGHSRYACSRRGVDWRECWIRHVSRRAGSRGARFIR